MSGLPFRLVHLVRPMICRHALVVLALGVALPAWGEGAWSAGQAGNVPLVNLWYSTAPAAPNAQAWDWDLGHTPPTAGECQATFDVYDLDNPGEALLEVGPWRYVLPAASANDGKTVTTAPIAIPAIYLRRVTTFTWTRTATQGFRVMGATISCPADVPAFAPRISLSGRLQAAGVIPQGCDIAEVVPKPFTVQPAGLSGPVPVTAACGTCTNGNHAAAATSPAALQNWAKAVIVPLKLFPEYCVRAWQVCWPGEAPICSP